MGAIAASYGELAEALLDEVEATLAARAARRREQALLPAGQIATDPAVRFVGGRLLVRPPGGRARLLSYASAEAEAALAVLGGSEQRAVLIQQLLALRRRAELLQQRRRLRDQLHELEHRRQALQRLRASEIADADRARRQLLRRRRLRGEPPTPSLLRPVQQVVLEAARALVRACRETECELEAIEGQLRALPRCLDPEDRELLADLRALVELLRQCTRLEYEPLERRLRAAYPALALATTAEAPPALARRFVRELAFLMAKANFRPLSRATLEHGFLLGPAPGVRLRVPLDDFALACFFVRGERLEPLYDELLPHFEKFAFCVLERDRTATVDDDAPRRRRPPGWTGRLRERVRRWWHTRRRRWVAALARRHRRLLAPRLDRVTAYLARLSPVPPPDVAVDPALKIKLFRDVRLGECGLVLPGASIRYRLVDLVLVWGGAAGGVLAKLLEKPLAVLLAPKLMLTLLAALVGRGLLGLRRSRNTLERLRESYENRHLQATRLHAVEYFVREAIETDAKEMLLAYVQALCEALERDGEPLGPRFAVPAVRVQARADAFLQEHFRAAAALDLEDAAGGLEGLGLLPRPGLLAPGAELPDYFDPRLLGRTYREAAVEQLLAASAAAARAAPAPQPACSPAGRRRRRRQRSASREEQKEAAALRAWLAAAQRRDADELARRDAGRPWCGLRPLSNAPRWLPAPGEADGEPHAAGAQQPQQLAGAMLVLLAPGEALAVLRERARRRLRL
ncbi:MAG: hypothetical protein KatS3mg102_1766 [Planctomycetota bacterium]|nr:MAG: hypothetical protein KatS3mg102_1766 [Planctomycetota bacterium]